MRRFFYGEQCDIKTKGFLIRSLLVLFSLWGLYSCTDDTAAPSDEENIPKWQSVPSIRLENRLLVGGAYTMKGLLYLSSMTNLIELDSSKNVLRERQITSQPYTDLLPSYFGQGIMMHQWYQQKEIAITSLYSFLSSVPLSLGDIDKNFSVTQGWYNSCVAVNNQNELLIAVSDKRAYSDTVAPYTASVLLLFDVENILQQPSLRLKKIIPVESEYRPPYGECESIVAVGSDFYISFADSKRCCRLLSGGQIVPILPFTKLNVFSIDSTDYLLGFDSNFDFLWYEKNKEGEDWIGYKFGSIDNGFMRWATIDKRVVGYRGDMMYEFKVDHDKVRLSWKALDNRGLNYDDSISSIVQMDSAVYITTRTGLFTKSLKEFFREYKK